MNRVAVKKVIYPVLITALLAGITYWLLNVRKMNDKIPTRGIFVYSKEFYTS
ncbi:hypothetical protein [Petroclostridium sp. X23]|uniref:hypothetical protein n=1 Tax=Petroclostridium sp. X23 TaxID=3045146 RepID=UPI0024ADA702|nr:hypothetical protein [Petroclostridium sp. X23]WHH60446.1 hypothetical protein QKW49_06925 [Petroclostridium sp. X23]